MKIIEPSQTPLTEDRYDSQFVLTLDSKGSGADVPKNLVVAMQPADFHRIKDRQKTSCCMPGHRPRSFGK